jgi:excisionase family DNA binding protein
VPRKNTKPKKRAAAQQHGVIYDSVDELAADLGLSRQATYAGLRHGTIPGIRIGKRFVIPRAAIAGWLRTAGGQVPVA